MLIEMSIGLLKMAYTKQLITDDELKQTEERLNKKKKTKNSTNTEEVSC